MIRVRPALARLGEGLAARAAAAPLLVVELFTFVGRAALALVELELAVACGGAFVAGDQEDVEGPLAAQRCGSFRPRRREGLEAIYQSRARRN